MRLSQLLTGRTTAQDHVANLDSSSSFVRAIARYLRGEDFPALGLASPSLAPVMRALDRLPKGARERLYARAGANEGIDPDELSAVDVEAIRAWFAAQYPERGYPAVLVGSPSGALVHLAALLGIPWLPQTFLLPVRRDGHPDDLRGDLEWGRAHGPSLLANNPDVRLHQLHDPNQDRLMIRRLGYFRVKTLRLGAAYEAFIETVLEPGGTIVVSECNREWPTTRVGPRHVYQVGGVGGIEPETYHEGSAEVERFLAQRDAPVDRWDPPDPDAHRPEAEWGFAPELREDVRRFADERGYEVDRLVFDDPHSLSPLVADCYRRRYAERGLPTGRLYGQSFALVEPWWTMRTGSVPYWSTFNTMPDVDALEGYLGRVDEPYEDVRLTMFSHGVESAGVASADRWRAAVGERHGWGGFVGVDPRSYPLNFGTFVGYHDDLKADVEHRQPLLAPASLEWFRRVAEDSDHADGVGLVEE